MFEDPFTMAFAWDNYLTWCWVVGLPMPRQEEDGNAVESPRRLQESPTNPRQSDEGRSPRPARDLSTRNPLELLVRHPNPRRQDLAIATIARRPEIPALFVQMFVRTDSVPTASLVTFQPITKSYSTKVLTAGRNGMVALCASGNALVRLASGA